MRVAVIADAHLGGPGGVAGPLVEQLERLPEQGCRRLVLLGDLFHVWVGDPRYETADVPPVVEALAALRAAGVRVDYVEGNRDFFIAEGAYAGAFDFIGAEAEFEAGGRRILCVHGDGLETRDRQYRFWKAFSKSALSRSLIFHLPTALARRLMLRTERWMATTNQAHRRHIPEAAILRYAATRLAEGYDAMLLGHFHDAASWTIEGGEVRIVEAWFHSRRVEWFGEI